LSRSLTLVMTGIDVDRDGPQVPVIVPWPILQTSSTMSVWTPKLRPVGTLRTASNPSVAVTGMESTMKPRALAVLALAVLRVRVLGGPWEGA
jgi:hypothetical protein